MKRFFLFLLAGQLLAVTGLVNAQGKYMTQAGQISFFSASMVEDIEARNQQVAAAFDLASKQVAFTLPITGFVFKRTLMQEHFNENYLESDKYPKATFTGSLVGFDANTLTAPGGHPVQVEGDLTMHGVTHRIAVPGTLELRGGQLLVTGQFSVAPADYNIKIPMLVRDHIAKVVSVRVALACDPVPTGAGAPSRPTN